MTDIIEVPIEIEKLPIHVRLKLVADLQYFVNQATLKYIKGHFEHGGNLEDRDCVAEVKNEIIDQWFYIRSHERQLKKTQ